MSNEQSSDLDREVDAAMRMFEKSNVGSAVMIQPTKPSRILLVLDGTEQDNASVHAAGYLRQRYNVETVVLDARIPDDDAEAGLAETRASEVSGARPIRRGGGEAYDVILAAVSEHDVDLVVLPCPFGRSFEQVGTDSAGTVIDVLLSRCPKPMLVVRREDQLLEHCVHQVRFIVSSECDMEQRAASWAFGFADAGATLTLNLVVEKEQYENIRSILEALRPEDSIDEAEFSEALAKTHQSLHQAMAKTAGQSGLHYHLQPQAGAIAPPNPLNESAQQLLVMPVEVDDRFTQGFVQDRIRRSPHPLLIVPGHVVEQN